MEEKLPDQGPVPREIALHVPYVFEALLPDVTFVDEGRRELLAGQKLLVPSDDCLQDDRARLMTSFSSDTIPSLWQDNGHESEDAEGRDQRRQHRGQRKRHVGRAVLRAHRAHAAAVTMVARSRDTTPMAIVTRANSRGPKARAVRRGCSHADTGRLCKS